MNTVIRVTELTKRYGTALAVNNVSFSVQKGEVVGFVGLNGAGKSTTINMLLGFQSPSKGEVTLFDERVTLPNAYKSHHRIGFATGDMSLFEGLTGNQYLGFVARLYGVSMEESLVQELIERFDPQLSKKLTTLSRGNKQKIALIAAFMVKPELVILDEPSSGLDPLMQQHFIELVREVAAQGTTVFMSSHYLNEVTDVCTRILLIRDGELVKDIPTAELESAAGKLVRVVTKQKVVPPKSAELITTEKSDTEYILQFVYKDKALRLQEWLGTLPKLQDVTITDHSTQAAFEDLYTEEKHV